MGPHPQQRYLVLATPAMGLAGAAQEGESILLFLPLCPFPLPVLALLPSMYLASATVFQVPGPARTRQAPVPWALEKSLEDQFGG